MGRVRRQAESRGPVHSATQSVSVGNSRAQDSPASSTAALQAPRRNDTDEALIWVKLGQLKRNDTGLFGVVDGSDPPPLLPPDAQVEEAREDKRHKGRKAQGRRNQKPHSRGG